MSIKRLLILLLSLAVLLTVLAFAFISSRRIDRYFNEYIEETYQRNVQSIIGYAADGLNTGYLNSATLNSYVEDPIYFIEIYDVEGNLVINSTETMNTVMGRGRMMSGMMHDTFEYNAAYMKIEAFELVYNENVVGSLKITREKNSTYTATSQLFRSSLLSSGLISGTVAILIAGLLLFLIIRLINNGIVDVVEYAGNDQSERKQYKISELNVIASSIDAYRIKLAQKERVKKQKLDQVLHDTKTPLTIMKSQLEGVADGVLQPDKTMVSTLLKNVDELDLALKNISEVVEGQETAVELTRLETDYSIELKKLVESLQAKFNRKGLKLNLKTSRFIIKTNDAVLNKVVYNLLINSFKYTRTGSVTVTTDNKEKTLFIKDTGIGIRNEDLARVFEPYYRGQNAKDTDGEGLGLYIVKEQVTLLKAEIDVRSELGNYTEFIIKF